MKLSDLAAYISGMASDGFEAQIRWWLIGVAAGLLISLAGYLLRLFVWALKGGSGPIDTST